MHQLDRAIEFYCGGDVVCAITLAGAAEEVLGQLCKRRGLVNALEEAIGVEGWSNHNSEPKDRRDILNQTKNALKHASVEGEDCIEIDEHDPYLIIARAIYNLKLLGLESSHLVKKFCEMHKP